MANLQGKRVAILAADGVEQVEYEQPRAAVEDAGATAELVSLEAGEIQAMNHDINQGDKLQVDRVVTDVSASDYDALLLPGGCINPDNLRMNEDAVAFVKAFVEAGKPVAAICHAPWTLVEADVVRGRTLTSYPSLRTDIENAGGNILDQEVVIDDRLITSRNPDDLPAFCDAILQALAADVGAVS